MYSINFYFCMNLGYFQNYFWEKLFVFLSQPLNWIMGILYKKFSQNAEKNCERKNLNLKNLFCKSSSLIQKITQNVPYLVFFPVMQLKMTYTVHIHFHLNSKFSLNLISTHLISLLINNVLQKRQNSQLHWIFERSNKNWEIFLVHKILPWKLNLNSASKFSRKMNRDNSKNPARLSWRERRREDISNAEYYDSRSWKP